MRHHFRAADQHPGINPQGVANDPEHDNRSQPKMAGGATHETAAAGIRIIRSTAILDIFGLAEVFPFHRGALR
jgi:hypothetical protein